MKKFDFQKKLEKLKDSDFLPGKVESWSIWIRSSEFSLPNRYMGCGFTSEQSATQEVERIKRDYPKSGKNIFSIEVKKEMVRRLKKPISIT